MYMYMYMGIIISDGRSLGKWGYLSADDNPKPKPKSNSNCTFLQMIPETEI